MTMELALIPSERLYHFFSDPGHAWLRVPITTILEYGLADLISPCSYINGKYFYLEEDCDAGVFIEALKEKGIEVRMQGHSTNNTSRIRSYRHYSNPTYVSRF